MVPIAASSRSAISRLARSSRRDFTSEPSSSSASRERSAPSAWIRLASSFSSRSASRRRSTALSSASSAAISRRVAASISAAERLGGGANRSRDDRSSSTRRLAIPDAAAGLRKTALRQALRAGNLRGKRGQRNAAVQAMHRKATFRGPSAFQNLGLQEPRCYPAPDLPVANSAPAPLAGGEPSAKAPHFRRIFTMTQVDHSTVWPMRSAALAMDAVEKANSGHPGLPMGAADIATVLFTQFLKFDAADPRLAGPRPLRAVGRPRLDAALFAAVSHRQSGHDASTQIKHFRQLGSQTPGHPENFHTKGVETTTGPLGQGIATAVGMALAEKHARRRIRQGDRRPPHLRARPPTAI